MTRLSTKVSRKVFLACLYLAAAGCNPSGSGAISAPPIPPMTALAALGDPGTPFSALVSDTTASWEIRGVVPLYIAVVNNTPPVRMIATKTVNNRALLSLQIVEADTIADLSSTREPFGSAQIQLGGTLARIAPRASPDVRFFVKGPPGETFFGLIEDIDTGFSFSAVGPELFLFEQPNGRVDGLFTQITNLGPFDVDLIREGGRVAHVRGAPSVTIK